MQPAPRRQSTGLPQTTPDNFCHPPPRRIMKPGRAPPHQPIHLARDTIRAAANKSEGGHRGEPADRQKATSTTPAEPTTTACTPAARPRSPYGRSCHRCVTIIQNGHRTTTILKVAATRRRPGRPWKGIPAQRHRRQALRVHGDPTRRLSHRSARRIRSTTTSQTVRPFGQKHVSS